MQRIPKGLKVKKLECLNSEKIKGKAKDDKDNMTEEW